MCFAQPHVHAGLTPESSLQKSAGSEGSCAVATTYHLHRLGRSVRGWCAAIASQMPRPWWPTEAASAVRIALTCVAAIYLAMLLELDRPEWAGWTVLSVSLATRASSLQKSLWRAVSTIIGCVIAVALTANFAQSTLAFDAALALWLALLTAAATMERGQRSYGFALIGFTVPIVTLGTVDQPDQVFHVAVDRCSTLLLGIACAHASSVLVAPGVREVTSALADRVDASATACGEWLRAVQRGGNVPEPPVSNVLALDPAVADAFTEQPSLQTGRRAVNDAPIRLLHVLAIGLLQRRLGLSDVSEASALLGNHFAAADRQLRRVRAASRLLRAGRRAGNRHTPIRPLSIDRDGRQAFNNAVRTAVAVSLANGFWYVSGWPTGGAAVTWTALASILLAARPNPTIATRNFLVGAALAAVVGVVVHYSILTTSGSFPLLAATLLPVCMLGALGRSDARGICRGIRHRGAEHHRPDQRNAISVGRDVERRGGGPAGPGASGDRVLRAAAAGVRGDTTLARQTTDGQELSRHRARAGSFVPRHRSLARPDVRSAHPGRRRGRRHQRWRDAAVGRFASRGAPARGR